MGSYNIEFDEKGNPILPKYADAMHRRAMAATTSRDTDKVHAELLKHESDVVHEFYSRVRQAVEYFVNELRSYHVGQPTRLHDVQVLLQEYIAEASRLSLKLTEIDHFLEDEKRMFDIWRQEDDRMRHARLSKHLRKQETGLYRIDRNALKISAKAKRVCYAAAETLRKIATLLDKIRRAFSRSEFTGEDLKLLIGEFNDLLRYMNREIKLLSELEEFERAHIALFDKMIPMDFIAEKEAREAKDFIL